VFLIILHSQFSIINSYVTEDDFAKAAGVAKVVEEFLEKGAEKPVGF
jgi:GH35 family endo-1,4-beta-xylanase